MGRLLCFAEKLCDRDRLSLTIDSGKPRRLPYPPGRERTWVKRCLRVRKGVSNHR